jgi:7-carboxy-7-deazaguanine synthase
LRLNEIFFSIQGEGMNMGRTATFIRSQTCNLRCKWCDTKTSWQKDGGFDSTCHQILQFCREQPTKLVVLTGGEPTIQKDFNKLVRILHGNGFIVTVETNCTIWKTGLAESSLITMSPKLPSSGERWSHRVITKILEVDTPKELKWVIKNQRDMETALFATMNWWPPEKRSMGKLPNAIIFQPVYGEIELDELFEMWKQALKRWSFLRSFDARVLPQIHKMGDINYPLKSWVSNIGGIL